MKPALKIAIAVVGLAVYLNIGWAIGTYFYDNVDSPKIITAVPAKILTGPGGWLKDGPSESVSKKRVQRFFSVAWPITLLLSFISWLGWIVFWTVWNTIVFLLWLIFAGGIAKLLGAG